MKTMSECDRCPRRDSCKLKEYHQTYVNWRNNNTGKQIKKEVSKWLGKDKVDTLEKMLDSLANDLPHLKAPFLTRFVEYAFYEYNTDLPKKEKRPPFIFGEMVFLSLLDAFEDVRLLKKPFYIR